MIVVAVALALLLQFVPSSQAGALEEEICDVNADSALGLEDYPATIARHRRVLQANNENALAHYHLGFAYGMTGHSEEEITEYLAAVKLGLQKWDLFLNLGRAYLERHELVHAAAALETAESLGPEHAETHFNLALVYERQNKLREALREISVSRLIEPEDLDAGNTNAIICAEMNDLSRARDIWTHLLLAAPDYDPARSNLIILRRWSAHIGQSKQDAEFTYSQPGSTEGRAASTQPFEARVAKDPR